MTWWAMTWCPYRTLVTQAPVGVMVGHLQVLGLTGLRAASLARRGETRCEHGIRRTAVRWSSVQRDDPGMAAISDRFWRRGVAHGKPVPISHCGLPQEVPAVPFEQGALRAGELPMSAQSGRWCRKLMKGPNPGCGQRSDAAGAPLLTVGLGRRPQGPGKGWRWQVVPSDYRVLSESSRCSMPQRSRLTATTRLDGRGSLPRRRLPPMLYLYYGSKGRPVRRPPEP